jgi:hypothetical protein
MKMKPSQAIGFCLVLAATAASGAEAQTLAEIARLKEDVRKLRLEMLQQRAEFQAWKVQNLTAWLEQTKSERQRAASQTQAGRDELAQLESNSAATAEGQSPELEALKSTLAQHRIPMLERWEQSLLHRESELASTLFTEQTRLAQTQEEIKRATSP